jgi:hypothetical protein
MVKDRKDIKQGIQSRLRFTIHSSSTASIERRHPADVYANCIPGDFSVVSDIFPDTFVLEI